MRSKLVPVLSAVAVAAALLLTPAAGQARAHREQVRLKDHCVVKKLPAGLQITACYPT
jgi:hypothetical protein